MMTLPSVREMIRRRRSCRSYTGAPVPAADRDALEEYIAKPAWAPFGTRVRLRLVEAMPPGKGTVPGTYGVIRGANLFLAGAAVAGGHDMEDFGYLFEAALLRATALGLGTCWMGGTFSRTSFAEKIGLAPDEVLPAVSPVGIPAAKRTLVDSVFRLGAGSDRRKPWGDLFFRNGFSTPLEREEAGGFAEPLEMLRLAPSASNNQPWRIIREGNAFHLFLQRTRAYDKILRGADLQRVDMGIAMCHFELSARELGLKGSWVPGDPGIGPLPERTEYIASWVT